MVEFDFRIAYWSLPPIDRTREKVMIHASIINVFYDRQVVSRYLFNDKNKHTIWNKTLRILSVLTWFNPMKTEYLLHNKSE